jgi:hypothetical protein
VDALVQAGRRVTLAAGRFSSKRFDVPLCPDYGSRADVAGAPRGANSGMLVRKHSDLLTSSVIASNVARGIGLQAEHEFL